MRIEVCGVQFENKGAELMLLAIVEKLRKKVPAAELVLGPGRVRPYERRVELGAYQYLSIILANRDLGSYLDEFLPKSSMRNYGLVRRRSIDLILDASGFAYGDNWGAANAIRAERLYRRVKSTGTNIVLMPQALGPFKGRRIRRAFEGLLEHVDLVFARDEESYQYVKQAFGDRQFVARAPDFTCLLSGKESKLSDWARTRVAVIPNRRMLDMVDKQAAEAYVPFMQTCIEVLKAFDAEPFLLLHDKADAGLAEEIRAGIDSNLSIVEEGCPMKLKGIIGACRAIVGSRYHGLVSALSQNVPAIAVGWSHKYRRLMEDYELSRFSIQVDAGRDEVESSIRDVIYSARQPVVLESLQQAAARQKFLSEEMWKRVWKVTGIEKE